MKSALNIGSSDLTRSNTAQNWRIRSTCTKQGPGDLPMREALKTIGTQKPVTGAYKYVTVGVCICLIKTSC